jgi:hypothetical protein
MVITKAARFLRRFSMIFNTNLSNPRPPYLSVVMQLLNPDRNGKFLLRLSLLKRLNRLSRRTIPQVIANLPYQGPQAADLSLSEPSITKKPLWKRHLMLRSPNLRIPRLDNNNPPQM